MRDVTALRKLTVILWIIFEFFKPVAAHFLSKNNVLIQTFKYEYCSGSSPAGNKAWARDVAVITTADGDLDVSGTIVTTVNITSPVMTKVSLKRRMLGFYIPVPCIKDFGSCDYPDLCVYGYDEGNVCPPIFDEHDVPCGCPIQSGSYTFPGGQFKIPPTRWAGILAGTYKGRVRFYVGGNFLACYNFKYTLQ